MAVRSKGNQSKYATIHPKMKKETMMRLPFRGLPLSVQSVPEAFFFVLPPEPLLVYFHSNQDPTMHPAKAANVITSASTPNVGRALISCWLAPTSSPKRNKSSQMRVVMTTGRRVQR